MIIRSGSRRVSMIANNILSTGGDLDVILHLTYASGKFGGGLLYKVLSQLGMGVIEISERSRKPTRTGLQGHCDDIGLTWYGSLPVKEGDERDKWCVGAGMLLSL
jgi:hypothetical protein